MFHFLINLKRSYKKGILIANDIVVIFLTLLIFNIIDNRVFSSNPSITIILFLNFVIFIIPLIFIFYFFGFYRYLLRYININYFYKSSFIIFIYILFYYYFFYHFFEKNLVIKNLNSYFFLIFFLSININFSRFLMLQYIKKNFIGNKVKTNCVIYGAGNAGKSLINSVDNASNINVIGFIDDDSNLRNTKIENYKILGNYKILKNLKEEYSNLLVLFSIINIDLSRKNFLINQMNNFNIKFKIIPSLNEIINDNLNYKNFRNVSINDLLFRSAVDSNEKFIKEILYKKNILVTGGAGSIGSQIVEEIIESDFSNLVVIDNSEENIFKLIQKNKNKKNFYKLKIHLETIDNISFLENIFKNNKFDLLYHAAAFKHVSIVEQNPFSAIKNNLLSTNILINLSVRFKVGNFVLISTDKAVKPKNYMGLSKRLAEILVQNYSYENLSTVFNIVRFGNVLGSSGSVIKIFQNQINNGGPITVFGKNTTRFFMTIKEACRLVIESTNHGKNGDIIILDMGKPIKIIDLAIKLINLNGLKHTFENINDKNHIKILFTELQKSEKKDEILSYEKNFFYTNNKKIMISSEYKLKKFDVEKFILALKQVIDEKDLVKLQKMIVENKIETKYFNLDFKYNNRKL